MTIRLVLSHVKICKYNKLVNALCTSHLPILRIQLFMFGKFAFSSGSLDAVKQKLQSPEYDGENMEKESH